MFAEPMGRQQVTKGGAVMSAVARKKKKSIQWGQCADMQDATCVL